MKVLPKLDVAASSTNGQTLLARLSLAVTPRFFRAAAP
jgi:hypothetical protein